MRSYAWPGNIRELRNVLERAVLLADEVIEPEHVQLPAVDLPEQAPARLQDELRALERKRIVDALDECGGNQTKAAELLGMSRRTLVKRLSEYSIPRPRKKS